MGNFKAFVVELTKPSKNLSIPWPHFPPNFGDNWRTSCIQARDLAEAAARSALQKRAVDAAEPFAHFNAADKDLRDRLRARGRQVAMSRLPTRRSPSTN